MSVSCVTQGQFSNIFRVYTPEMVFPSNLGQGYPGGRLYTSGESYTMEVTVRDLFQYRFMFSYPLVSVSHVTQSQFPTYSVYIPQGWSSGVIWGRVTMKGGHLRRGNHTPWKLPVGICVNITLCSHIPTCVCVLCHTESIFQHIPCKRPRHGPLG